MFKIIHSEKAAYWYLKNPMLKPDPKICGNIRNLLAQKEETLITSNVDKFKDKLEFLKSEEKKAESYFKSEQAKFTQKSIFKFFGVSSNQIQTVDVLLLPHLASNAGGGTFCKGFPPLILFRVSPENLPSLGTLWHEYIHYVSYFSDLYLKRHDEMVQTFNLDKNIRLHPSSIVSEGMAYVAEPTIRKKELPKRNIKKSVGIHRAWGQYREQTLTSRSYSDLQNVMDTIPDDWNEFMKWWEEAPFS